MLSLKFPAQVLLASTVLGASVPQTIRLTQKGATRYPRGLSTRASNKNIDTAESVSEPLQNLFEGTDLQWFGNISFGTPPQTFWAVFDTGSFDIEVPGIQCALPCINQRQFDYTKSSTFLSTNETAKFNFETGGGVEPSDFESLDTLKVVDTMMLLGLSIPNTAFFLITNQTYGFSNNVYDGIVGLGFERNSSVFTALKKNGLPALFSMYFTPHRIGDAELTLGGINATKLQGSEPVWAPIFSPTNQRNMWSLVPSDLIVNGHAVENSLIIGRPMIFDSGTSNIVMPKNLTTAMYALISPNIKAFGTLGSYGIPCSEIPSISAEITFTFTSTSGGPFNLTIPSKELSVGPFNDNPSICQTLINSMDIGGGGIIGGSLLKHYYSIWDVDHARLGFKHNGF